MKITIITIIKKKVYQSGRRFHLVLKAFYENKKKTNFLFTLNSSASLDTVHCNFLYEIIYHKTRKHKLLRHVLHDNNLFQCINKTPMFMIMCLFCPCLIITTEAKLVILNVDMGFLLLFFNFKYFLLHIKYFYTT